jgi:2-amino-4-hydroxy-6-hydroxymethyldihydropteridine diphosphokinase
VTGKIFLLLGSNLGDREKYLTDALQQLEVQQLKILKYSSVYSTEPWGMTEQDGFLNVAVQMESEMNAFEILEHVQKVELNLGKEKIIKWGPRTIDIDLLYFNGEIIETDKLVVPHPEIQNRSFTLVPMIDLDPDFVHPVLKKSQVQLLNECTDSLAVTRFRDRVGFTG